MYNGDETHGTNFPTAGSY